MIMDRRSFLAGSLFSVRAMAAPLLPLNTLGSSADLRLGFYETIEEIRGLGFRTIEIQENNLTDRGGARQGVCVNGTDPRELEHARRSLTGFDHVSIHLPWTRLNYGGVSGPSVEDSVKVIDAGIKLGVQIGAHMAVLHARPGEGMLFAESKALLTDRIRRWADLAARDGMRIGVETGTPASVHEFVDFVGEIRHPEVGATLDVGHQRGARELLAQVPASDRAKPYAAKAFNDINLWLVETLGPKLFHLHLHDLLPETWSDHQPLRYGFIDFPRLFHKLRDIRYRGLLVLEIGPMDSMHEHLRHAREVLERDLRGRV